MARRTPPISRVPFEQRPPTAKQVIAARQDAGLTQVDLAALLGIAQPNVALLETGARIPSQKRLARILDAIAAYRESQR